MPEAYRRYVYLVWQFTKRDIQARYRGSTLGLAWTLISPLLLLGAFTLVFYGFFDLKWPVSATGSGQMDFALQVFAGLVMFNWFSEAANRGPGLIVNQPNLVTKVIFPLPLLALTSSLASGFQAIVSLLLLLMLSIGLVGPSSTWITLPALLLPFWLLMVGVGLWLSALGVYLRDLTPLIAVMTSLLMFLSPIFYPLATVPERWQALYLLNPLAFVIHELRGVLYLGAWPDWIALGGLTLFAAAVAVSGLWLFNRLREGFADVL